MYEMRAESTLDRSELVWHVLAKDRAAGTLCGCLLAPAPAEPLPEPAAERYCAPCMNAFSVTVESRRREAAEHRKRAAAA
ncbi:hypothetical protein ACWDYJ_35120 [Streptomyces sp. NPDC003042]